MEVSKVTLTDQTRARLQNPTLGRLRRQELRRELVMEYIKTKPNGSIFTTGEINKVAFPEGHLRSNVLKFIKAMKRDHLIDIEAIPNTYKYILIPTDATTVKKPEQKLEPVWKAAPESEQPTTQASDAPMTLSDYARDFAWEKNSDSLREFITFMDGKELDLRRLLDRGGGGTD